MKRLLLEPLHNESTLLEELYLGNESAFRKLYDAYSGSIYTVALQHLKHTQLAEDIVQIVFLKVWEKRASLREIRNFSPWLYTVCRNSIINILRKQDVQDSYRNHLTTQTGICSENPETTFIKRDIHSLIQQALTELSPQQRIAFHLQRTEGLSYEDIGLRMGIATNTVRVHLYKAHQFIRHYLQTRGVDSVAVMLLFFTGWW